MSGLRALWLVRRNLTEHRGGDTVQIEQTAAALRRQGVVVDLHDTFPRDVSAYDLVHLFHLDRLWENLDHARRARAAGLPVVLSTIYWPADEFDRGGRAGLQGRLARRCGSSLYQDLRLAQRCLLHGWERRCWPEWRTVLLGFRDAVQRLLKHTAVLLPNSAAEQREIERLFEFGRPAVIVPNAADAGRFGSPPEPAPPRSGVLCVGRIEPRKNQLALIEALRGTDIPLTLVGDAGRFSRRYYERCRRAAEGGGGSIARSEVRFLPGQPVEALPALYHGAEVHACVSWYETPGLVNLEAALCGCAIVATRGGSTPEYLGEDAHYADPGSPERIRGAVEGARRRGASRELAQRVRGAYTWDAAAARTIEGYRMALKAHR